MSDYDRGWWTGFGVAFVCMAAAIVAVMLGLTGCAPASSHGRLGTLRTAPAATGYCYAQQTALGGPARWGTVAVPRGSWLLRHELYVPAGVTVAGHRRRWFTAQDVIGSGSRLDIFVPPAFGVSEPDCSFGRRTIHYRVAFP